MAGEGGKRVGVDHHGPRHLGHEGARERLGLRVEGDAGAERDRVTLHAELHEMLARFDGQGLAGRLGNRLGHGLHAEAGHDRLLGCGRGHGAEPHPASERGAPRQRRRSRLSDRPGDDEQVTVGALVSFHRPRRKELADVGLVYQEGADAASHLDVRDADGNDHDAPRVLRRRLEQERALQAGEGDGERGAHGVTEQGAAVGAEPGREIEGDHGNAAARGRAVDLLDDLGGQAARRAGQSRAEQGVHHEIRLGQGSGHRGETGLVVDLLDLAPPALEGLAGVARDLGAEAHQEHAGARALGLEVAGDHEAITAVVALAAEDEDAAAPHGGPLAGNDGGRSTPRVLHEPGARNVQRLDGPSIQHPHLGGGEHGLHRYRPRAAVVRRSAHWDRKSASMSV